MMPTNWLDEFKGRIDVVTILLDVLCFLINVGLLEIHRFL